jgi:uncharacterized membrane protein YgaE (UPF0421/DUF939 family)
VSTTAIGAPIYTSGREPASRPALAWLDRFVGSDPGLNRFRLALQCVISIGIALAAEWLFVHLTHALQIDTHGAALPAAQAAAIALQHHELLIIAMMLGAMVCMLSTFGISDTGARAQLISSLFVPIPMIASLALGLSMGAHRVLSLAMLAVLLAAGAYLRRFGPRGFLAGNLLFMGDFLGYFLHGAVTLSDMGWLVAEIGVGVVVALLVRFALFYPRSAGALRRTQRSYAARARKVARLALELFDEPAQGPRRLQRGLIRLNETALMIDAQLADPSALPEGSSAQQFHQLLFDAELALTNVARFTQSMAGAPLPQAQRDLVRQALVAIRDGDAPAAKAAAGRLPALLSDASDAMDADARTRIVIAHRFARSVIDFVDAIGSWMELGRAAGAAAAFQPSVMLAAGWLTGSGPASAAASLAGGDQPGNRFKLQPYTRVAIQMGVAVGLAIVIGDILSGRRFYWAVIAAFITFMGANNSGEQVRKALFRVVGTVVGIFVGALLAHAVGTHTGWSIAVILIALFFGLYLMRINYGFFVVGITVMVSQLYVQLDEFSDSLLVLRLEETALGAAIAILTVLLVLPIRTRQVVRIAMRGHLDALATLVRNASGQLLQRDGRPSTVDLRQDARRLDDAEQALIAAVQPLRRNFFGAVDPDVARAVALASGSRNYGRNLIADIEDAGALDDQIRDDLAVGCQTLNDSLAVLVDAVTGPRNTTYMRSSALFDRAERRLEAGSGRVEPAQLVIRDFTLIDASMARLAGVLGLTVANHDTATLAVSG